MTRRLAYLLLAALFLVGATSCGKKEEKQSDDDDGLQMRAPAAEQAEGGAQAG